MNSTHRYIAHFNSSTWEDMTKVKELENTSFNKLIQEGCRMIIDNKMELNVKRRKQRTTLSHMV
jgi:hypothetical protein